MKRICRFYQFQKDNKQKVIEMGKIFAQLNSYFPKLYSIEENGENYYLITEAMSGKSLQQLLDEGKQFKFAEILHIIFSLTKGISHEHSLGVVHQNISPQIIFIDSHNRVKLATCGLRDSKGNSGFNIDDALLQKERRYKIKEEEAIYYWSPELYQGNAVCEQSDIYSLGVLFYYLLTNHYPLGEAEGIAYLNKLSTAHAKPIKQYRNDCPEEISAIVLKMLEPKRVKRYSTMQQISDLLSKFIAQPKEQEVSVKISRNYVSKLIAKIDQDPTCAVELQALSRQSYSNAKIIANKLMASINRVKKDNPRRQLSTIKAITAFPIYGLHSPLHFQVAHMRKLLLDHKQKFTNDQQLIDFITHNLKPKNSIPIGPLDRINDFIVDKDSQSYSPCSLPPDMVELDISFEEKEQSIENIETKEEQITESIEEKEQLVEESGEEKQCLQEQTADKEKEEPPLIEHDVPTKSRRRLGSILIALGTIDKDQLEEGLALQTEQGMKIGEALIDLGYLDEVRLAMALARQFSIPYVNVAKGDISEEVIDSVPRAIVEERNILPVKKTPEGLIVAFTDPLDIMTLEDLRFLLGCEVSIAITHPTAMEKAIKKYYDLDDFALEDMYSQLTVADIEYSAYDLDEPKPKPKPKPKAKAKPQIVSEEKEIKAPVSGKVAEKKETIKTKKLPITKDKKLIQQDKELEQIEQLIEKSEYKKFALWEKLLSEEAGAPGPIERIVAQSYLLIKTMQNILGTYFLLFANFIDMCIDSIASYVRGILRAWKTSKAIHKRMQRKDPNLLAQGLWQEYIIARVFLYRMLYHPENLEKQIKELQEPLEQTIYSPDLILKLILELRNHLDEMKRDLSLVTEEEIAKTIEQSGINFLLSFIPNPIEILSPIKDFIILASYARYSRSELDKIHGDFIYSYHRLLQLLKKRYKDHSINYGEQLLLPYEASVYFSLAEEMTQQEIPEIQDISAAIVSCREALQRLLWILCKPRYLFDPAKWSYCDLLNEMSKRKDFASEPLYDLYFNIFLAKCIKKVVKRCSRKERYLQEEEIKHWHFCYSIHRKLINVYI